MPNRCIGTSLHSSLEQLRNPKILFYYSAPFYLTNFTLIGMPSLGFADPIKTGYASSPSKSCFPVR